MIKNFFKIKKHKFYIKGVDEFIPPEEVIVPAIGGPSWFQQLCPFVGKHKTTLDAYYKASTSIRRTAKSCPGMLDLFKNSFLIKFPCDVILETMETGEHLWQKPSKTEVLTITHHPEAHVESTGPLASCILIQFCLPFIFQAPHNKVTILDPVYWKLQPYKVAPGVMNFKTEREALSLNVICLFEKKNKIYEFKKGEPLCIYNTSHHSTLEINNNLVESPIRQDKSRTFTHRWASSK
tara:strand:+ start:62 stop:772 length:711 start_codon:yes stop_codon:yes gene_type:complete